jgi:hypothetical protein
MRTRSTVPTDCRYIDARVAESVTTALYVGADDARIIAPRATELHALVPRSPPDTP